MNVWLLIKLFSFKKEISIVLITLAIIISMPVFTVFAITQAGISAVSSTLAAVNPISHLIEIKNPNGIVVKQLQASTVWPTTGQVTTEFGDSTPYQVHHTGIDIAGAVGDPITPFMVGTVTYVNADPNNKTGYGKYVIVDHEDSITSLYGHMSDVSVTVGQQVKPGDTLGLRGNTGHSTGPHLHFEIRVYIIPANPRVFMVGDPTN